jgi:hypothetical protein
MTVDLSLFPAVDHLGAAQVREGQFTGPLSYATGGDPVNVGDDLKMSEVWVFLATQPTNGTTIRHVVYDRTANTLKWFLNDGSEVGNGVDLSTYSGQFFATGK